MKKEQAKFNYVRTLWRRVVIMTFSLICLLGSTANAVWIGQSQLNPFLQIKGAYDSNIFRIPKDEEGDFITILSPGIHYEYPTAENPTFKVAANYRADVWLYTQDGDATIDPDGQLNRVDHHLDGFLFFNFASGLSFDVGYLGDYLSNPPDFPGDTRDYFYVHNPQVLLGFAFADRYEIELEYDGRFRRYTDTDQQINDYNQNGGMLDGFYNITPKVALLIGGIYAGVDRKEPFLDSIEYAGYGGARYEVTGRTSGIIKIGGMAVDSDDENYPSESGWYASGELVSQYSERTRWSLNLNRRIRQTTTTNDTALYGPYAVQTIFGAKISHALASLPNLSFSGWLDFGNDTYPDDPEVTNREDDIYRFGAAIDYELYRYITLGLDYNYTQRNSTVDLHDFIRNVASIYIRGVI